MKYLQYNDTPDHLQRGKCSMISFPYHELYLLDALEDLARAGRFPSKSHYVRALIKEEYDKLQKTK